MLLTEAPPLAVAEAQRRIVARIRALPAELVGLAEARGRVLAEAVVARADLPPWDNSAMDGYALRSADVAPGVELPVLLDVPAGAAADQHLPHGGVARIMTGAPLPHGADAVVPVEATEGPEGEGVFARVGERIRLAEPVAPGSHVRPRGEDVRARAVAIPAGALCRAGEIAMAATVGRAMLLVHRRPRVAIVSTGDELVDVDQAGAPDRIVNGNAYGVAAQVAEAGGDPWILPIAPDEQQAVRATLAAALAADAVVTIGGVSVGARDLVKEALEEAGVALEFWRVSLRPGGPMAFGVTRDGRPVFALPGNPVSAHVTFALFARPALKRMAGHVRCFPRLLRARLAAPIDLHSPKTLYVRGRLSSSPDGWRVAPTGAQGSSLLSSLVAADALIVVPPDAGPVQAGTEVEFLPLGDAGLERSEP
ncbi:MAG: gephyrin-like molybdotransferase Glp [Gemmatimonadota bacterium]